MTESDFSIFDKVVCAAFSAWVTSLHLALNNTAPGVYEIVGSTFVVRIRLEIGHGQSILVTLMKREDQSPTPADVSKEIGLGVIARFKKIELHTEQTQRPCELMTQANYLAGKTSELLTPYLLGLTDDFDSLKDYVQTLIFQSGSQDKEWHFPKNVRKEWIPHAGVEGEPAEGSDLIR